MKVLQATSGVESVEPAVANNPAYLFEGLRLDGGVHKEGIYAGEDGRGSLKE